MKGYVGQRFLLTLKMGHKRRKVENRCFSGKCVRFGAGRSRFHLSVGSYQDLMDWYCSLLTRRTVCGRAAGNTPRTQKQTEWNETRYCTNSIGVLQDHCSYKAPTATTISKKESKLASLETELQLQATENRKATIMHELPRSSACCSMVTGVRGGVEAHPQKFWIGENPLKFAQNVRKLQKMYKSSQNCCMCVYFTKMAPKMTVKTCFGGYVSI